MADVHANADFGPVPSAKAVSDLVTRISKNVKWVIVGHHDAIEDIIVTLSTRGHLLLEDMPGVGKMILARAIATSIEREFGCVQSAPDLLPSDVTGISVFDQQTSKFEFREGPVFGNVTLGDEINHTPLRTQVAPLEIMEELQVTVDGVTRRVPGPFTVIAAQNDVGPGRTYDLPLVGLDRFMKRIYLGYPIEAEKMELLGCVSGRRPIRSLEPVASADDVRNARKRVLDVTVSESAHSYVPRFTADTRVGAGLSMSPYDSAALVHAVQARATLNARNYVVPDGVQRKVRSVWAYRIQATDERAGRDVAQRAPGTVPAE